MKKPAKAKPRRKRTGLGSKAAKWAGVLLVAALAIYGVSQMSSIVYGEADLPAIDFSSLTSSQKRQALEEAHRERCTCGCGMNLAQCVATDMTCPVRERNIEAIRTMARDAATAE
jgi:hypothetical protein